MSDATKLDEILSHYEQRRLRGDTPTAEELCRDCPELLPDIRDRLRALEAVNDLLQGAPSENVAGPAEPVNSSTRYCIERFHARGGLGEVHLARDSRLQRDVALKRLRPEQGQDADCQRRFIREAEVTSRLEHPGIVPVYGLGADAGGQPWYAMRFVRGDNFKEFIDRFHRDRVPGAFGSAAFRQLLTRFVAVCNTVAYAHSQGVIHRDLKPANIMLGPYGETLVVDWGLAKADDRESAPAAGTNGVGPETQQATAPGRTLGTPAYMSPEQAAGRWEEVGPASDIHGLGATLYALLTGKPPIAGASFEEVLDRARRGVLLRPRQVVRDVPAALEAICLKAMAFRPQDRYPGALDLAADVERWLADEPVSACRDPWAVWLRRWARRHRTLLASAGVLVAALLVASAGAAGLLAWTNHTVRAERDRASQEAAKATAINRFLIEDLLEQAMPERNAVTANVTVRELLDRAAKKLDGAFADQPEVEATLRSSIGLAYYRLGLYAVAEAHLRRAHDLRAGLLGEEHPETLSALQNLSAAVYEQGRYGEVETMRRRILDLRRRQFGPEAPETLLALNNLGTLLAAQGKWKEAEPIFRAEWETLQARGIANDEEALRALNNLAQAVRQQGNLDEAERLYRQALAGWRNEGDDPPLVLSVRSNLAAVLLYRNKLDEAEPLFRQGLEARRRQLGPRHPDTLLALNNLAFLIDSRGRCAEAEPLFREVRDGFAVLLGPEHPNSLVAAHNHALAVRACGRTAEAEELIRAVVAARRKALPPEHPDLAASLDALAVALAGREANGEAEPLWREAEMIYRKARPAGHADRARVEGRLGECLVALRRHAEAEALLLSSFEARKAGTASAVGESVDRLIRLYESWGRPEQAREWRNRRENP